MINIHIHNNNNGNPQSQKSQKQTQNFHFQPKQQAQEQPQSHYKCLPKRLILVRHGQSEGNKDEQSYANTPDHKIPLTPLGIEQAQQAGSRIVRLLTSSHSSSSSSLPSPSSSPSSSSGSCSRWKAYFYVSPYDRARSTLREIGRAFPRKRVIGVREECRIREQDFGNFQVAERMKMVKEQREKFGRFFYRFPEGESAADVFDRVSSFLESLWRDIDMNRLKSGPFDDLNLIIISHGLALRVFLMKWFKWSVEQFEYLSNFENCEFRVMQLGEGGEYSLAVHHSEEEMLSWGLSQEMVDEQKWRARANRGECTEKCSWYLETFFDEFADPDETEEDKPDQTKPTPISLNGVNYVNTTSPIIHEIEDNLKKMEITLS